MQKAPKFSLKWFCSELFILAWLLPFTRIQAYTTQQDAEVVIGQPNMVSNSVGDGYLFSGQHEIRWDGVGAASGIYFILFNFEGQIACSRVVIIR